MFKTCTLIINGIAVQHRVYCLVWRGASRWGLETVSEKYDRTSVAACPCSHFLCAFGKVTTHSHPNFNLSQLQPTGSIRLNVPNLSNSSLLSIAQLTCICDIYVITFLSFFFSRFRHCLRAHSFHQPQFILSASPCPVRSGFPGELYKTSCNTVFCFYFLLDQHIIEEGITGCPWVTTQIRSYNSHLTWNFSQNTLVETWLAHWRQLPHSYIALHWIPCKLYSSGACNQTSSPT